MKLYRVLVGTAALCIIIGFVCTFGMAALGIFLAIVGVAEAGAP